MGRSFKRLSASGRVLAWTVAIAASLIGSRASASIPDVNGVVHACYTKSTGTIRIIDNSVTNCKNGETALQWPLQGPMGPQGQQGIQGPQGLQGLQGPAGDTNVVTLGVAALSADSKTLTIPELGDFTVSCSATLEASGTLAAPAGLSFSFLNGSSAASFVPETFSLPALVGLSGPATGGTAWLSTLTGTHLWKVDVVQSNGFPAQGIFQGTPCVVGVVLTTVF